MKLKFDILKILLNRLSTKKFKIKFSNHFFKNGLYLNQKHEKLIVKE